MPTVADPCSDLTGESVTLLWRPIPLDCPEDPPEFKATLSLVGYGAQTVPAPGGGFYSAPNGLIQGYTSLDVYVDGEGCQHWQLKTCALPANEDTGNAIGGPGYRALPDSGSVYRLAGRINGQAFSFQFSIDANTDYSADYVDGAIPLEIIETSGTVPVLNPSNAFASYVVAAIDGETISQLTVEDLRLPNDATLPEQAVNLRLLDERIAALGGQTVGESTTYAGLPTTDPDGSTLETTDYAVLTQDDDPHVKGIYRWDGAQWVLSLAIPNFYTAGFGLDLLNEEFFINLDDDELRVESLAVRPNQSNAIDWFADDVASGNSDRNRLRQQWISDHQVFRSVPFIDGNASVPSAMGFDFENDRWFFTGDALFESGADMGGSLITGLLDGEANDDAATVAQLRDDEMAIIRGAMIAARAQSFYDARYRDGDGNLPDRNGSNRIAATENGGEPLQHQGTDYAWFPGSTGNLLRNNVQNPDPATPSSYSFAGRIWMPAGGFDSSSLRYISGGTSTHRQLVLSGMRPRVTLRDAVNGQWLGLVNADADLPAQKGWLWVRGTITPASGDLLYEYSYEQTTKASQVQTWEQLGSVVAGTAATSGWGLTPTTERVVGAGNAVGHSSVEPLAIAGVEWVADGVSQFSWVPSDDDVISRSDTGLKTTIVTAPTEVLDGINDRWAMEEGDGHCLTPSSGQETLVATYRSHGGDNGTYQAVIGATTGNNRGRYFGITPSGGLFIWYGNSANTDNVGVATIAGALGADGKIRTLALVSDNGTGTGIAVDNDSTFTRSVNYSTLDDIGASGVGPGIGRSSNGEYPTAMEAFQALRFSEPLTQTEVEELHAFLTWDARRGGLAFGNDVPSLPYELQAEDGFLFTSAVVDTDDGDTGFNSMFQKWRASGAKLEWRPGMDGAAPDTDRAFAYDFRDDRWEFGSGANPVAFLGGINAGDQRVRNVAAPISDDDAARLVDTKITGYRYATTSTVLSAADAGAVVEVGSASAETVTIPADATVPFALRTHIDVVRVTGDVTIVPASGVTLRSADGYTKLRAAWSGCSLYKRAANDWVLVGDLAP